MRSVLAANAARNIKPTAFANGVNEEVPFSITDTQRGTLVSARDQNGVLQSALFPRLNDANEDLTKALNDLVTANTAVVNEGTIASKQVHPNVFAKYMAKLYIKFVTPRFVALQKVGRTYKQERARIWAEFTTPNPAVGTLRSEYRSLFLGLSLDEQARRINVVDAEELAAISEGRSMFNLPGNVINILEDRLVQSIIATKPGINGSMALQPSAATPLAVGPDHEAIAKAAANFVKVHRDIDRMIDQVEAGMRQFVTVVAVACDLDPDTAYNLLIGKWTPDA